MPVASEWHSTCSCQLACALQPIWLKTAVPSARRHMNVSNAHSHLSVCSCVHVSFAIYTFSFIPLYLPCLPHAQRPACGYRITVFHTFNDEVNLYRKHAWQVGEQHHTALLYQPSIFSEPLPTLLKSRIKSQSEINACVSTGNLC